MPHITRSIAALLGLVAAVTIGLGVGARTASADAPRKCVAVDDANGNTVYTICVPFPIGEQP